MTSRGGLAVARRADVGRLADWALTRLLHLPPVTASYAIHRGVRIAMRDGTQQLADHYAPAANAVGTLLVRVPYGRGLPNSILFARIYAARGYHVVLQSVRGTFGSEGSFDPVVNEAADGADTVAWLRNQPWFTGSFGMIGMSYLGLTQWALLENPPPELVAAVITVGPNDFSEASWGTGSFSLIGFLSWSDQVSRQEATRTLWGRVRAVGSGRRLTRAMDSLPLGSAGRALLGNRAPWYEDWLAHPDRTDPFWAPRRLDAAPDRADIPVLLIAGWQDVFLRQSLDQYARLHRRGTPTALTVGAWTHMDVMVAGAGTVARESLEWLDEHLAARPTRRRRSPVRIEVTGDDWVDLPHWPPPADEHVLFLAPDVLTESAPAQPAPPSSFVYDPANPTPTVGGPLLAAKAGYRDDSELALRPDVLSFTGAPLTEDLDVVGIPVVDLAHSSDNPNVDLFIRLSEVSADGRSRNVSDGYRRLDAPGERFRLELGAIAHRFRARSRIRLLVAGGSHPQFARNTGSGEPPITATRLVTATHSVHHHPDEPSRLILPVVRSAEGGADPVGDPR